MAELRLNHVGTYPLLLGSPVLSRAPSLPRHGSPGLSVARTAGWLHSPFLAGCTIRRQDGVTVKTGDQLGSEATE